MNGGPAEAAVCVPCPGGPCAAVLHLPGGPGPHPAVACLHGLAGEKGFYTVMGRRLAAAGAACLRLDFRGCGASPGRLEDLTLDTQLEDVRAAVRYLRGRPETSGPLALLGFSMGGGVAALLAAEAGAACLALWAPLLRLGRYTGEEPFPWTRLEGGRALLWEGKVAGPGLFESARRHDPFASALAFGGPVFAAHGGRDASVPPAHSQDLARERRDRGLSCRLLELPESGHLFEAAAERAALYQATTAFLTEHLKG